MAVNDADVFPDFPATALTQLSFQSNQLLFAHTSAEVRGENMPERQFASTGYEIHNHQVVRPTQEKNFGKKKWHFLLFFKCFKVSDCYIKIQDSAPGELNEVYRYSNLNLKTLWKKEKMPVTSIFFLFPQYFLSIPKQISAFELLLFCCLPIMLSIWTSLNICCL